MMLLGSVLASATFGMILMAILTVGWPTARRAVLATAR